MRNSLATQRLPAEQTVVVPGTRAAAVVIPSPARQLTEILDQRRALEGQLGALLEAHPLSGLLISVPGIGVRTAATILALSATAARSPPPTASLLCRAGAGHQVLRQLHSRRSRAKRAICPE